jgi:aerobic C4-dicarboxylate transport protein
MASAKMKKPWYRELYILVLIAVVLGILIGWWFPSFGKASKLLADGFIKLIKMIIAPIIFCTLVHGIASVSNLKKVGRIGGKALIYFELVSTLALVIGLVVVNVLKPGAGLNFDPKTADPAIGQSYLQKAGAHTGANFFLDIIPSTLFEPFVSGDLLSVLLVSLLVGFAISLMGKSGKPVAFAIEQIGKVCFGIMELIVWVAPIGAFGGMAYTVGSFGLKSLDNLLVLMIAFLVTSALFVLIVLGLVARVAGFSIFRFINFIRDEILLVIGTSSSETALPGLMKKLELLGCSQSTVGLVVPAGYSFNLDGTNIYMTMGALFLAQATNTSLDLKQQLMLVLIAMLTSKGASGVTGAGFIVLAATLAACKTVPVESLALLVGIDRFMSGVRTLTNLIGNGVATVVISRWEKELTVERLNENLAMKPEKLEVRS